VEFNKHSGNYVDRSFSSFDRQGKKTIIVDGCSMAGEFLGSISEPQDKKERDRYEGGDIGINLSERFGFNHIGLNFPAKSNCSIFRDTTNFLLNKCGEGKLSYNNLLLVVSWTGLARYSYFNREKMAWEVYHLWKFDGKANKLHPGKNMDYHSIIEEYMNRFLYQISIANLCENLGVNYVMYNGCDDITSYKTLDDVPPPLTGFGEKYIKKIKRYFKYKNPDTNVYNDFDNLYEVLLTKNFLEIPCNGYFGYESSRYKMDKGRLKKYTFDGLHLNKLGHQEWVEILEDFIIEKGMGDFIK
jgi:hypothetical protein